MATETKKARIRHQREREKCRIDDFCKEHDIENTHLTEYQIRLKGDRAMIDVYPTSRRYCVIIGASGGWGSYKRIEDLLIRLK